MAIAPNTADLVVEIILEELSHRQARAILNELKNIDGGPSFNETIKMLLERVVNVR